MDLPEGAARMNDRLVAEAEAGEMPPGAQVCIEDYDSSAV